MSNPVSNSEYGADSVFDLSELSGLSASEAKEAPGLYSSGSLTELSGIQSEAVASKSESSLEQSQLNKDDSIKPLWSASDASHGNGRNKHRLLPSEASPFVYDAGLIRYNTERGVDYRTPLLCGSRKLVGARCESGYHPSHLVFDPARGTLAAGYDVNNGWAKLPNFSIIGGIGNSSELDGSFVSGSYNSIKLELLNGTDRDQNEGPYCLIPPSCSIIGGANNNITNNSPCQSTSSIIASHDIHVKNCENVAVVGMRSVTGDVELEGFSETTFTRNLYALSRMYAGPHTSDIVPTGTVLVANGDTLIKNNIHVNGNVDSKTITAESALLQRAVVSDLVVTGSSTITPTDIYIQGTGGSTGINVVINPDDNYGIVYANPINGTINIYLGTGTNNIFSRNRTIIFKDVTLEYGQASSHNVNILVPSTNGVPGMTPVRIEFYNGGYTAGTNAGYSLNSSGGSVTFVFTQINSSGFTPTWTIQNQFIGNPRIMGNTGITFIAASDNTKSRLIKRK